MDEQQLKQVYEMVDSVPFSRSKRHLGRDFSDGVMMAELVHHYQPKLVNLHNYPAANSLQKKIQNWNILNNKVFKKIGLLLTPLQINELANSNLKTIELILYKILLKLQKPQQEIKINLQHNQIYKNQLIQHSNKDQNENNNNNIHQNNKQQYGQDEINIQIRTYVNKIQQAYNQLMKLQEISKLKDQSLSNLEKKLDQILFK